MDPPSSSSPGRDDVELQYELEQIAFQMELDKQADVDAVESDVDAESGDEDGPRIGKGAWAGVRWQDPLDPHPFPQRDRRSMEALDLDYEPEQRHVMKTRQITMKQFHTFS